MGYYIAFKKSWKGCKKIINIRSLDEFQVGDETAERDIIKDDLWRRRTNKLDENNEKKIRFGYIYNRQAKIMSNATSQYHFFLIKAQRWLRRYQNMMLNREKDLQVMNAIKRRNLEYLGHIMRNVFWNPFFNGKSMVKEKEMSKENKYHEIYVHIKMYIKMFNKKY